jgi:hypothetical protein
MYFGALWYVRMGVLSDECHFEWFAESIVTRLSRCTSKQVVTQIHRRVRDWCRHLPALLWCVEHRLNKLLLQGPLDEVPAAEIELACKLPVRWHKVWTADHNARLLANSQGLLSTLVLLAKTAWKTIETFPGLKDVLEAMPQSDEVVALTSKARLSSLAKKAKPTPPPSPRSESDSDTEQTRRGRPSRRAAQQADHVRRRSTEEDLLTMRVLMEWE